MMLEILCWYLLIAVAWPPLLWVLVLINKWLNVGIRNFNNFGPDFQKIFVTNIGYGFIVASLVSPLAILGISVVELQLAATILAILYAIIGYNLVTYAQRGL